MDYRVSISMNGNLVGKRVVRNPTNDVWFERIIYEITLPIRRDSKMPMGEYVIQLEEVSPGTNFDAS